MQKATITKVYMVKQFGEIRAHGICVQHPNEGHNGIYRQGEITTSSVMKQFKNGNFITRNTKYKVIL